MGLKKVTDLFTMFREDENQNQKLTRCQVVPYHNSQTKMGNHKIHIPACAAVTFLAFRGASEITGDVGRHWAVGGEEEMRLRNSLEALAITDLQRRCESHGCLHMWTTLVIGEKLAGHRVVAHPVSK